MDDATVRRMLDQLQTLLGTMAAHPQRTLAELPLLSPSEHHHLLVEWNQTAANYPRNLCIHELFEAQVERTPVAVAVSFEERHLTYRELNNQSNQLAYHLLKLVVGPYLLVGLW